MSQSANQEDKSGLKRVLCRYFSDENLELEVSPSPGGDCHRSYAVSINPSGQMLFAKVNNGDHTAVLATEYQSLQRLNKRLPKGFYPQPVLFESDAHRSYLLLEFHQLVGITSAPESDVAAARLGKMLAQQHRIGNDTFGWDVDNHIGLTPQTNNWLDDWPQFFAQYRLLPQLDLAARNGLEQQIVIQIEGLLKELPLRLHHADCKPALLHGDLWAGNAGFDLNTKQPILFDAAPYFGDREADIAMTELFGGFPNGFYQSYNCERPLSESYPQRRPIYNLYHALNHFNLFGGSYAGLVQQQLAQIFT